MSIPLPVISNTYRCALIWQQTGFGTTAVNVIHVQATTSGSGPGNAFSAISGAVTAGMWASTLSAWVIQTVNIIPLDGVSSTTSYSTGGASKWGGTGTGGFAPQVATLVKIQTGLRGRNRRGRVYLPATSDTVNQNGSIASATNTTMQTAWSAFLTSLGTATPYAFELGVASYDRAHGGAGAHFQPAVNCVVEALTASQRRRQPGRKVARHRHAP